MADVWFSSGEGLRLYARDSGAIGRQVPVLCLSGLTRNSKDFAPIFERYAPARRIVSPDYRGRGRSQYASDWTTYRPDVELDDAVRLLDRLGIVRAAIIGTSRGGIVGMLMAVNHADRLAGLLLNDVGPALETAGLLRIRGYLGKEPELGNWDDAVTSLKRTNAGFETLSDADWMRLARSVFRDEGGRPAMDYDPSLALAFPPSEDISAGKVATVWELFDAMPDMPIALLRGQHSDLLSQATVNGMIHRRPSLEATIIPGRGHVPFLDESAAVAAIDRWLGRIDVIENRLAR